MDDTRASFFVIEQVGAIELFDYIVIFYGFSERLCCYFFLKLVKGLHHINSRGLAHKDLKSENVVLSDSDM